MRRAVLVFLTAWWALGLTAARPAAAAAADHLTITTVVANVQAGAVFSVQVEARDGSGALDAGFTGDVTLHASALGGADFTAGNVVPAAAGVATFNVVLANAANNYSITATAAGLTAGVSNRFNVTATHLAVLALANVRAGDPFNATVQARDANNNLAENFAGSVDLNAGATGGSNFVGGTINVPAASAGTASLFGVVLNNAADGYTLTASSPGLTSGVSNSFAVTARRLVITTVVPNMQAGTAFNVTVEARDANNAAAENFSGNVALNADGGGGGSNFAGGNSIAAAGGTAAFNGLALNDAANNYSLTASATGVASGFGNNFNVTATHLAVLAVANVHAGDAFDVTVQARDANNNLAENFAGNVALNAAATGGSNFVGGTRNVSAAAGVAAYANVVLTNAANGYLATASSAGLTNGVSNSFDVSPGQLVIVNVVPNHQAGTSFDVTVEARDANNAVAENFTGNVTLDAAAVGGSNFNGGTHNTAAGNGTATFTGLALDDAADAYTITASAAGLAGAVSNTFNVTATHLAVLAAANVRAGDPFTVTVEARDANNNLADNFTGSVDLNAAATGGSNFVGGTRNVPAATAGTATFANIVLDNAADDYTITASSAGLTNGVSNSFDVGAGQLVIVNVVPNHQAGTLFSLTVEARDANNAVAENFTGNVAVDAAAVGGSNFDGGTQNTAATNGTANFTNLAIGNAADGYTITATATGLSDGVSNIFNVTPGRPDISIDDVSVTEGNAGATTATFTVTLSRSASNVVTVDYATAGASATSGTDFVSGAGTLTFAPGVTSQSITVTVKGDLINETDEIFVVSLTDAVNGELVDAQGIGSIRNDDPQPAISAQPVMAVEGSSAPRTATLTVRLSAPSGQQIRVTFQTADGTAVDGVGEASPDYTASTGTLVFAAGQTEQTVTVALRNDLIVEADEYFFVDLRTPVNATIATPRAKVTIVDDDSPVRQLVALGVHVLTLDIDIFRKANLLENVRLDCNSLRAFQRDVTRYRGTYIAPAEADSLLAAANRLRADLGCRP